MTELPPPATTGRGQGPSRSSVSAAGGAAGGGGEGRRPTPVRRSTAGVSKASTWILAYVALLAFPLVALFLAPVPDGLGFWWDLSMGLGFAGLAVAVLQFGLTARFRRASAPFGMDILYYFHRWMAVAGLGLLLAHFLILRATAPGALLPVQPASAPLYMTAGRAALVLFLALVLSSLLRKALKLEYDRWRALHIVMAVAAVLLSFWHVAGAGYYTSVPGTRILWIGYTGGWVGLVAYVRLVKPWSLLKRPYRVTGVRPERGRTWTLTLEPEGHPGLRFSPGQFAWLTLRASPFRAREHPFSFAGSAAADGTLEFAIRELGDFTRTIGETRVGEVAWVDGPYGVFTTDRSADAPEFVFVVGGVGVAPIMSMLRTLADRGDRRPIHLVYANDRWDDVLFREELDTLATRLDLRVTHVLLKPGEGWTGETGFVTREVLDRVLPPERPRPVYFLCGPKPMVDAVDRALLSLGVPLRRIHLELFDMV